MAIVACTDQPATQGAAQVADTTAVVDTVRGTAGSFYKRYSGTLGNHQVVFNLEHYGTQSWGCYYDLSTNRPVKLVPDYDAAAGNQEVLVELGAPGSTGKWSFTLTGDALQGTRTGSDHTTTAINLQEQYPEGSHKLVSYYFQDTGRLFKTLPQPKATVAYAMLWPAGNWPQEAAAFVQSRISVTMNLEGRNGVQAGLKTRSLRYFSGYRNDLTRLVDTTWPEARLKDMAYNYSTSFYHHVLYNDHDWLVLENVTATYTGGAHGMYSSAFQNLDMKTMQDWHLAEVIKDSASVKPYLELAARDYFGIKSNEDLSSRLLTTTVPITANFYITPAGLTFVYNPYELASYSDGEVQLFVPFEKLMNVMTAAFKERMNFNPTTGVAHNQTPRGKIFSMDQTVTNRF